MPHFPSCPQMVRHFTSATLRALTKKGIRLLSLTPISHDGGFANTSTGYNVDDNGTHRIWSATQVLAAV